MKEQFTLKTHYNTKNITLILKILELLWIIFFCFYFGIKYLNWNVNIIFKLYNDNKEIYTKIYNDDAYQTLEEMIKIFLYII